MQKMYLKKALGGIILGLSLVLSSAAQKTKVGYCGFDESFRQKMQSDENYKQNFENIQQRILDNSQIKAKAINGIYYIPVVFHVVSNQLTSGSGNPLDNLYQQYYGNGANTYDRIGDQLNRLNLEFQFAKVQFCLATKAPPSYMGVTGVPGSWQEFNVNGNTVISKGVTFDYSTTPVIFQPSNSQNVIDMETLLPFNQTGENHYLDIYLVDGVLSSTGTPRLGEAPFGVGNPFDDIAVVNTMVGDLDPSVNPGAPYTSLIPPNVHGKVAVHEVGHWLALLHVFERDQNCGTSNMGFYGDYIQDTPPQEVEFGLAPYNTTGCNALTTETACGSSTPLYFNNHMDYSGDDCKVSYNGVNPFTPGQNTYMETFVDLFRGDWHSEINLINTGLGNSGCLPNPLLFTAEFNLNTTSTCSGQPISLQGMPIDCLGNGEVITSWSFTIDNQINPPQLITFNGNAPVNTSFMAGGLYGPGSYTISLRVDYEIANVPGFVTYAHPETLEVLDCSASDLRYTKTFNYVTRGLSDLAVVSNEDPNDEFYFISGTNQLSQNEKYVELFKISALGEVIWHFQYKSNNKHARCFDIIKNSNTADTYILVGYTTNNDGFRELLVLEIQDLGGSAQLIFSSQQPKEIFVQAIDNQGRRLEHSFGLEIINTQDGGFAIAGGVAEGFTPSSAKKQLLVKLDQNFGIEWMEDFDFSFPGDPVDFDVANSIRELTQYTSPNNPQTAYFLGGAKRMVQQGTMLQGLSALIVEDDGAQRSLTPVVNNAWNPGDAGYVVEGDVLYESQINRIYQICYSQKTHGFIIVRIDPATATIEAFREVNLLNEGMEFVGLKMIHSNDGNDIIVTGLGDGKAAAVRVSKSNWTLPGTITSGGLNTVIARMYNFFQVHQIPFAAPDFPALQDPILAFNQFYYAPKSICKSAIGGYMYVLPGKIFNPLLLTNNSSLNLLKLDDDLLTGCEIPKTLFPQTQFPVFEQLDPVVQVDPRYVDVKHVPDENPVPKIPCSSICFGGYQIEACSIRPGGTSMGVFDLNAGLSNILQGGMVANYIWHTDPNQLQATVISNPSSFSAQNGAIVYVQIETADGCISTADVELIVSPPPTANNLVLQSNNLGFFDLTSFEVLITNVNNTIVWYSAYPLVPQNQITNPTNYPGPAGTVYAQITDPNGCVAVAEITLDCTNLPGNWPKRSIGTSQEVIMDITTDQNGNYYATGYYYGTFDFLGVSYSTSSTNPNFFVLKITECDVEWIRFNQSPSYAQGTGIDVDANGNVFVSGMYKQTINLNGMAMSSFSPQSAFIAKYNANGSFQWVRNWGTFVNLPIAHDVAVDDNSNNVYVTGETGNAIQNSYFLRKYTSTNGAFIWNQNNTGGTASCMGDAVDVAPNGDVYMTGVVSAAGSVNFNGIGIPVSTTNVQGMIARFSASGTGLGANQNNFIPRDIVVDSQGNPIITGAVKFNGFSFSFNGPSYTGRVFVAKYNSNLTENWARVGTSTNSIPFFGHEGYNLALDEDDNIFVAGQFCMNMTFGNLPTMSTASNSSLSAHDIFVIKYNTQGIEQWGTHTYGGYDYFHGFPAPPVAITHDHDGFAYLGGRFNNNVTLNNTPLSSNGTEDLFMSRVADLGSSGAMKTQIKEDEKPQEGFTIYPNPSKGHFHIGYDANTNSLNKVEVFNFQSQLQMSFHEYRPGLELNLSHLSSGIYLLRLHTDNGIETKKIVLTK